jgi:diaminopimelate decarboxylase
MRVDWMRDQMWHRLVAARPWLRIDPADGLCFDGVPLARIAQAQGTPTWVYSASVLRGRLARLHGALAQAGVRADICYAVKANDHLAVLTLLRAGGAGADVTSAGEMGRALAAGMTPARMVYSGVGKRDDEIEQALAAGIGQINVESAEELPVIAAVARRLGVVAPVALRVNPDIAAGGHDKISTGRAADKFGIDYDQAAALFRHAASLDGIAAVGFSTHIGSQIFAPAPFEAAYRRVLALVDGLAAEGFSIRRLDLGGGFGIPYDDGPGFALSAYAAMVARLMSGRDLDLLVEPGRWLVGPAGILLASVTRVKRTARQRFVVLDAGMNDLLRPALYDAHHGVVPVSAALAVQYGAPSVLVGPVCETSDRFGLYETPDVAAGSILAVLDAGAYGAVMSSSYNGRPLAAQILLDGGRDRVIRARQSVPDLWRDEIVPEFLNTEMRG